MNTRRFTTGLDVIGSYGCKATTTVVRPVFPPNRVIREGEAICTRCGSGKASHANGTRGHEFTRVARS